MLSTPHTYASMGLERLPLLNSEQQEDLSSQKAKTKRTAELDRRKRTPAAEARACARPAEPVPTKPMSMGAGPIA